MSAVPFDGSVILAVVAAVVACALAIYLLIALFYPEKFS